MASTTFDIAIIGSGVSGIAYAAVLKRCGHRVTVYEKGDRIGGVWATTYPGVRIQNLGSQYLISGVDLPKDYDLHPTAEQIMNHLNQAVTQHQLDVRTNHQVLKMLESSNGDKPGWKLTMQEQRQYGEGKKTETVTSIKHFDKVVVAVGQYTQSKHRPSFHGEADFVGKILTERDLSDYDADFSGKRVAVVGFGKSALDVATFAASRDDVLQVQHIFRQPRWMVPFKFFGVLHYTHLLFARHSTVMVTCWAQPTAFCRFLHDKLSFIVTMFWWMICWVLRLNVKSYGVRATLEGKARLKTVLPDHELLPDLRSSTALEPVGYLPHIAAGRIQPYHAELTGFDETGITLGNGQHVEADVVVLSLGCATPTFPFMPDQYRELLESESDGAQLYRHIIHPQIPNVAFAGFNHGFLHIPSAEVGALWTDAYFCDRMVIGSDMEKSIAWTIAWKRKHIHFEPSRSCAVNMRFHQYLDIMLQELGLPYLRKMPNIFAETFVRYTSADYAGVVDEYLAIRSTTRTFTALNLDT